MRSKVTSTVLLHSLVPAAKALNVLPGLPKHRVPARTLEKQIHGLDISCGIVGPRRMVFMTNSRMKQKVLKYVCILQYLLYIIDIKIIYQIPLSSEAVQRYLFDSSKGRPWVSSSGGDASWMFCTCKHGCMFFTRPQLHHRHASS